MGEIEPHAWATVTVLPFRDPQARDEGLAALEVLIRRAHDVPGLEDVMLLCTEDQGAVMIIVYASEQDADHASAQLRPHIGEAVGPHVTGPPQRWAGHVLLRASG